MINLSHSLSIQRQPYANGFVHERTLTREYRASPPVKPAGRWNASRLLGVCSFSARAAFRFGFQAAIEPLVAFFVHLRQAAIHQPCHAAYDLIGLDEPALPTSDGLNPKVMVIPDPAGTPQRRGDFCDCRCVACGRPRRMTWGMSERSERFREQCF